MGDSVPKKRSFPKKKDSNGRLVVDKDKVRDLYFASPEYDFAAFCREAGFPTHVRNQQFPTRQWRDEKLREQIDVQDTSIIKDGISLRATILQNRIKSIKRWDETARSWKQVLEYKVHSAQKAIEKDLKRQQLIDSGLLKESPEQIAEWKPNFNLSPNDLFMMTLALEKMHSLEQRTLLVPSQEDQRAALGIPTIKAEEKAEDAEEERINQMGWTMMNAEGLTNDEIGKIMGGWFDQLQDAPPPEAALPEPTQSTSNEEQKPEEQLNPPESIEIPPLEQS